MLYLTQLLKLSTKIGDSTVRPLAVIIHLFDSFGTLTRDEFTYLAPLCISAESTAQIEKGIKLLRQGTATIDDIIIDTVMVRDNYKQAYTLFMDGNVTESLVCKAGINRKSRHYDRPLYTVYCLLHEVFLLRHYDKAPELFAATSGETLWRKRLFDTSNTKAIAKLPEEHVRQSVFYGLTDEQALRRMFFRIMHIVKTRKTLRDYYDLNRRYLMTTGIFVFDEERVAMDVLPTAYFKRSADELYLQAYTADERLTSLTSLAELFPATASDEAQLLADVSSSLGEEIATADAVRRIVELRRKQRFDALVDHRFTDEALLALLDAFDTRNDNYINNTVTGNADAPTIFEYILAIIWYKASGREGQVLHYMKLSLDTDLLPVTHAAGGEADIVYEYEACPPHYPKHTLLLEATLADNTNQDEWRWSQCLDIWAIISLTRAMRILMQCLPQQVSISTS